MKKLLALLLAAALLLSLAACGGGNNKETDPPVEQTTPSGTGGMEDDVADTIVLYYGSNHYGGYEATFYCPEGAYIDEDDLEEYKEDGSVMSFTVYDDVREYQAYAENHWSREIYTTDPEVYDLTPQLYFYGELDDYNAAEYENCSQTITDLGFQWEGKDVMLLETRYTMPGYSEQVELFVGVEFENRYWRVKDGGGTEENLTAPGLLGFEISSWNELTVDQCAWIAGQLFGVDSGRTWPLEDEGGESTTPPAADVDVSALYGTWAERDSSWDNKYVFNEDGTGVLVSGPQYPFTYEISGNILTLTYDDDDQESFEVSVNGETLTFVDSFGSEIILDKSDEEIEIIEKVDLSATLIGIWVSKSDGETYAFNADGTGYQIFEGTTYGFTYELDEHYLWISYDDGDTDDFGISIEGDTLTIANNWTYTRQQ